nr:hypothetical protein GCM10017745_37360 [Saccharothrix mutabilis subsp. capreolus]
MVTCSVRKLVADREACGDFAIDQRNRDQEQKNHDGDGPHMHRGCDACALMPMHLPFRVGGERVRRRLRRRGGQRRRTVRRPHVCVSCQTEITISSAPDQRNDLDTTR